jgi:hypothetical protein
MYNNDNSRPVTMGNINVGGIQGNAVTPDRTPLVHDAFLTHDARIQDLEAVVNKLEQKLAPVMHPVGPSNGQEGKNQEHMVPLVATIDRASGRLAGQVERLRDILNRLEI